MKIDQIMISISKIILIWYFIATKFSELEKYEDQDAQFKLIKEEFQTELYKQDGFQMVDANYKEKVWSNLFYTRTLTQNIITMAVGIEIFLYFLTALYLTVVLAEFFYIKIKKACKSTQETQ
jgi:hypothetical protein